MSHISTSKLPQEDLTDTSMPAVWPLARWRERLTYAAMSLLVAWHTLATMVAPLPDSEIRQSSLAVFDSYLNLLDLDHKWTFFAPEIGKTTQLRYLVEDAAGVRHTFALADKYSRNHPTSIWFRERDRNILDAPDRYWPAEAEVLCREHAALRPVSVTLLEVAEKDFEPADHLKGKHPLDPEYTNVTSLKTVPCAAR